MYQKRGIRALGSDTSFFTLGHKIQKSELFFDFTSIIYELLLLLLSALFSHVSVRKLISGNDVVTIEEIILRNDLDEFHAFFG